MAYVKLTDKSRHAQWLNSGSLMQTIFKDIFSLNYITSLISCAVLLNRDT